MSNTEANAASTAVQQPRRSFGRPFPKGVSGNPAGRKPGSRNKLAEAFVTDLRDCWEKHGVAALERVATEQPEVLLKVIASLMPKDLSLTIGLDPTQFAANFRQAVELLGNEPTRAVRSMRVINAR